MKCLTRTLFLTLPVISFLLVGSPHTWAQDLDENEVRELVSGNTVEAVHAKRGYLITTYYLQDGTFRQDRNGERETGTWSINEEGQLCTFRTEWGGECRAITREDQVFKAYKIPNNTMKPRQHKRTFIKIIEGNPHNL